MKHYYSPSHNPYLNIALEKWLLDQHEPCFYFWQNNPCCIMGRNQNPYQEIDGDYASKHHIAIVRRFSGGGTVYQDLGNINFTYISKTNDATPILDYLKKFLSLPLERSGRNDLEYQGKKVSGMAYYEDDGYFLIHGTLLVDVNLKHLSQVLQPSPLKLKSHAITSVGARVKNLHDIDPSITPSKLFEALTKEAQCLTTPPEVVAQANTLATAAWIYGNCPSFEITHELKAPDGIYHIQLKVQDGIIEALDISTDALNQPNLSALTTYWVKKIYKQKTFEDDFITSLANIKSDR